MGMRILPSSEVRDRIASVIKEIKEDGTPCFLTQHGRATAVLMAVEVYDDIMSRLEDLEDEQDVNLFKRLQRARQAFKKGHGVNLKYV